MSNTSLQPTHLYLARKEGKDPGSNPMLGFRFYDIRVSILFSIAYVSYMIRVQKPSDSFVSPFSFPLGFPVLSMFFSIPSSLLTRGKLMAMELSNSPRPPAFSWVEWSIGDPHPRIQEGGRRVEGCGFGVYMALSSGFRQLKNCQVLRIETKMAKRK